jgi:hypothetical protein
MNNMLQSLKSDLLDRRMLPILLLLGVAFAGAIAYTVLDGGGSSASPVAAVSPTPPPNLAKGPALSVTQAPLNPNAAVAETTEGGRYQHHGGSHNPFTPLASPKAASTSAGATKSAASSSSPSTPSSSPESKTGPSGTTGPSATTPTETSTPIAPKQKPKPKPVYLVSIQFGLVPATPGELSQLTPYSDLKRLQPLPYLDNPLIVFAGARSNGKGAIFTLSREAIVKGQGTCLPSATQCEAVELAVGQVEELDYLEPDGQSMPYELKVTSITKKEATAATAARLDHTSKRDRKLVEGLDLQVLSHLRFSSAKGTLVYLTHHGA